MAYPDSEQAIDIVRNRFSRRSDYRENLCSMFSRRPPFRGIVVKGMLRELRAFFVTVDCENIATLPERENCCFVIDPNRRADGFIRNAYESLMIFLREKPDIVLTLGAGAALPICLWAKLFGKKVVFIECFSRVTDLTLTGKLLYPWADLFLVQWQELCTKYPRAKYVGAVL